MSEILKIYIDRLRNGESELLKEPISPAFMDVEEGDLQFKNSINVDGEAYTTADDLVISLKADTEVLMPCLICNKMITVSLVIEKFYHTIALENLKEPIYDFGIPLREQILLELPHFVECDGRCPERNNLKEFLGKDDKTEEKENHYPFSDLE